MAISSAGDISGRESAQLAELLGINKSFLRLVCHYAFFFKISFYSGISLVLWKKSLRWMLLVFVLCWLDEASKIIIIGRHFSWIDTGKNVSGVFVQE